MENRRLALIAVIGVILFTLYKLWQTDYPDVASAPPPPPPTEVQQLGAPAVAAGTAAAMAQAGTAGAAAVPVSGRITVTTDRVVAQISPVGGDLVRLELTDYPQDMKDPSVKFALLNDQDGRYFILESGLAGASSSESIADTRAIYQSPQPDYHLLDGQDAVDVPLSYSSPSGYVVHKLFRFHRGSYSIDLSQTLENHSGHELQASPFTQFVRTPSNGKEPPFVGSFTGVGIYEQKADPANYRFVTYTFKKLDDTSYSHPQTGGWIAMLQHYFIAAVIPKTDEALVFNGSKGAGQTYIAQAVGQKLVSVADGQQQTFVTSLYIGPKEQKSLDAIAPGMNLTQNYGLWTPISAVLFKILSFFHGITGNWGWSIVLLTVSVKLSFFKLSEAQYRSTAKMRKFTPRIQELRERYAGDREKLNKATMELYKKEGFNPLAGCWPLLIQMPIFFGLYRVLIESVELRQAPFVLWLNDLSAADPYFVLPVLYGISMWAQQRLSGQSATMDPAQQKVMNIMPIGLTGLFLFFPVGLVLYWLISNLIGIAQQWIITRRIERDAAAAKR